MPVDQRIGGRGGELLKQGDGTLEILRERSRLDDRTRRIGTGPDPPGHPWQEVQQYKAKKPGGSTPRFGRERALFEDGGGGISEMHGHLLGLQGTPETWLGGSQATQATHEIFQNGPVGESSHRDRGYASSSRAPTRKVWPSGWRM